MTAFIHLDFGGTIIVYDDERGAQANYRCWIKAVVLEYHDAMTLESIKVAKENLKLIEEGC